MMDVGANKLSRLIHHGGELGLRWNSMTQRLIYVSLLTESSFDNDCTCSTYSLSARWVSRLSYSLLIMTIIGSQRERVVFDDDAELMFFTLPASSLATA